MLGWKAGCALLAGVMFLICGLWFLLEVINWNENSERWLITLALLSAEIVTLASLFVLQKERDQKTIEILNQRFGKSLSSINALKREWINQALVCKERDYFGLAERFEKMRQMLKKHGSSLDFSIDKGFEWIYNPEAKTRVLTLLVLLTSTIAALSIPGSKGMAQVIAVYAAIPGQDILTGYIAVLVLISVSYFSLKALFEIAHLILSKISDLFVGRKARSDRLVRNLIRDLIKLHRAERIKLKIPQT